MTQRPAHPWTPPFEKTMGVLVRAETEDGARRLAQTKAGRHRPINLRIATDLKENPA